MRINRINSIAMLLIFAMLLAPTASAKSSFRIGFGISSGHCHSSFGYRHFSHHGLWRHGHYHGGGWVLHGWYRPSWYSCSSGTRIHVSGCWPVYLAPRVVERHYVVGCPPPAPRRVECKPSYDADRARLVARVRNKKSELLKMLKIGDKKSRMKAISQLVGYSFDENVRKALEETILNDPDPELRMKVAESMGKVKNLHLIATLEKVGLQDADPRVREQADKAIKKIKAYR